MADVTARSLQYEYKAVSMFWFLKKPFNTDTKNGMYLWQLSIRLYFQAS